MVGGDEEKLSMPTTAKQDRKSAMAAEIAQEPDLLMRANLYYERLLEGINV